MRLFFMMLAGACVTSSLPAQTSRIVTGSIRNKSTQETISAASVVIKGTNTGAFSDEKGVFRFTTNHSLPDTLIISSVGFSPQEVVMKSAGPVNVTLEPSYVIGQDVVVAASRLPERILESPVSIERISAANIRNSPVPDYYSALTNVLGVDMTTSSILFKTPSTRGFNSSGNVRFNQLVDGMDNQAPGLNFSVGSVIGLTELDVESMELLEGASSALYGPGGMNGTLLINSKDPFKYQGLSVQVKEGVMNVNNSATGSSPYHDMALRWGQKISDRFAFKISGEYLLAPTDWVAHNASNYDNIAGASKPGNRQSDPSYNGVNLYGDEIISQVPTMLNFSNQILQGAGAQYSAAYQAQTGAAPSQDQVNNYLATNPQTQPFYVGVNNGLIKDQVVTRTGYNETDIANPKAWNLKLTGGLYYKISETVTASLSAYWGTGNTVYTGSDRYALRDLKIGQYKAEIKGSNWFLHAYTTQEDAGKSYNMTVAAELLNEAWKPTVNTADLANSWYPQYIGAFVQAKSQGADDVTAHNAARAYADQGRPAPGSTQFNQLLNAIVAKPISQGGALFLDKTNLYMVEGQYNLTSLLGIKEKTALDVLIGGNFREYLLNSQGTLFADKNGKIPIKEEGAYLQLSKKLLNDVLKLTVSGRYDKNQNFDGHFTPRASAVVKIAENQHIRLSYQTAYRFPSTQNQWIDLYIGGGARLLGGLPSLREQYNFNTNPVYTQASFQAFAASGNPNLLMVQTFGKYKPESSSSYEIGYKALFANKLLLDVYGYYATYKDFLGRINVFQSPNGMASGLAAPNIFSISYNSNTKVNTYGYGVSLEYLLPANFSINTNFYSDDITNVPTNFQAQFNTPKYRANIGFGNNGFGYKSRFSFNVVYRWQDNYFNESTFINGPISAFSTLDAQLSFKMPNIKSIIKLGAANLTNNYYVNSYGNPSVGGLYYVSFGYNVF